MASIQIPGYKLLSLIGRGGMSHVYKAIEEDSNTIVAIKIINPRVVDESFRHRFEKECKLLLKMEHTHVIHCYDSGQTQNGDLYMVLEYLSEPNLKQRLKSDRITLEQVMEWLLQVADALHYIHSLGYFHRDIKPENILIDSDDKAIISDFGIAKSITSQTILTSMGMSIGTPYYMSPEQAKGRDIDHKSDIYSLGVVLYEMLTGTLPYTGDDAFSIGLKHLSEPVPVLPHSLSMWQPILEKLMAKEKLERYDDCIEVIEDIRSLLEEEESGIDNLFYADSRVTQSHQYPSQNTETVRIVTSSQSHSGSKIASLALGACILIVGIIFLFHFLNS